MEEGRDTRNEGDPHRDGGRSDLRVERAGGDVHVHPDKKHTRGKRKAKAGRGKRRAKRAATR